MRNLADRVCNPASFCDFLQHLVFSQSVTVSGIPSESDAVQPLPMKGEHLQTKVRDGPSFKRLRFWLQDAFYE